MRHKYRTKALSIVSAIPVYPEMVRYSQLGLDKPSDLPCGKNILIAEDGPWVTFGSRKDKEITMAELGGQL